MHANAREAHDVGTMFAVDPGLGIDHHLALARPPEAWLRWTAFRYQLPTRSQPRRVAVWRALRALHAVNLDQGEWAVPHDAYGRLDLTSIEALVARWGGQSEHREVGGADVHDLEQQVRLWRSCERIWDEFLSGVDRLSIRLSAGAGHPTDDREALQTLRERFAGCLVDDLVGSDAAARSGVRLAALTDAVGELHGNPDAESTTARPRRISVELRAAWGMDDGRARHVVSLCPTPTVSWAHDFEDFESAVYSPSRERMAFRHGSAVIVCPPDSVDELVAGARSRVALFERSQ